MNSIQKAYSHDKERENYKITIGGLIKQKRIWIIAFYEVSTHSIQKGFTIEELQVNHKIMLDSVITQSFLLQNTNDIYQNNVD
jgi:hypothetical protein